MRTPTTPTSKKRTPRSTRSNPHPMERDLYNPNLNIGYLFSRSWPRFKENAALLIGAFAVYAVIVGIGTGGQEGRGLLEILAFIITGPLLAGLYWMMLKVQRDEPAEFTDLFAGFSEFGRALGVYVLYSIAVVIGLILLVVPGIVLAVGLWPALYLILDDDLGVTDTLSKAWDMTKGQRWRLFALGVVLFFFTLLGLIALIVGVVVTGALAAFVSAAAYDELALAYESEFPDDAPDAFADEL